MMPLQFKGGAVESHPHAFFQFWSNAEAAPHHHGYDEEEAQYAHNHDAHEHPDPVPAPASKVVPTEDSSFVGTSVAPPGLIGIGQVSGFAMALILLGLYANREEAFDRLRAGAGLAGRTVLPLVPPPRA